MIIPPPVKYPTPYGGRLEWQLPGGNKLIAHLKDKAKIRHRKRWSQVNKTNNTEVPKSFRIQIPKLKLLTKKIIKVQVLKKNVYCKFKMLFYEFQVMYMYYFLAHKLMNIPKKTKSQRRVIAENTFLLALDGDVDFQPKAVQLLVDRMKKNPTVGAACGRIHPIGSGTF